MTASTNPVTSRVGLEVLQSGGNAVDAAVAMAATHVVVEPHTGHLGGDSFMMFHLARSGTTLALNASGAAPSGATREHFCNLGGIPEKGPLASCVPGTVDGWAEASRQFGTMPLADLLGPAVEIARQGFPVQNRLARSLKRASSTFRHYEGSARQYLNPNGDPPRIGEILRQPWLADTLETIGQQGADSFYRGALAQEIVDYWQGIGGLFTLEDFASHHSSIEKPLTVTYRGFDVMQQPLPSQGLLHLLMLNIVETFPLKEWGLHSPDAVHCMLEAKKLAFQVKDHYLGDPERIYIPVERLLDKDFAAELAEGIDMNRARNLTSEEITISSDTDFLCVVDKDRNIASNIHSLFPGCGVTVPGVGALFNSRMLSFSLQEGHPNAVEPGKRPLHTLNTWMLFHEGRPLVVGGVTAGDLQVQFNLQIVTQLIDGGAQLHEALDAPRWGNLRDREITLEDRDAGGLFDELGRRGHQLTAQPAWGATGRAHAIAIDYDRGILIGHSESRDDGGFVMGY